MPVGLVELYADHRIAERIDRVPAIGGSGFDM
jgi:hypothetical protein